MQSEYIKAKKSLGQNFLIDHEALIDISSAVQVRGKHIIEVGPGYGALTDYLIQEHPKSLDLVELDRDMVKILCERYTLEASDNSSYYSGGNSSESKKMVVHNQDILTFVPPYEKYSVIANIPYYITSPILFRFLYDLENRPDSMVIMMQKEVGEKILEGRSRKPHHSFLSLAMELASEEIALIRYVPSTSFEPAPKVDSIVLRFVLKKERNHEKEEILINLWKRAFTHPRKTLLSNLKGSTYDIVSFRERLLTLGYDERVRAEAVKMEDWGILIQGNSSGERSL